MTKEAHEEKNEETLIIRRIRNGTVIDHIPCGRALQVLKILHLPSPRSMSPISVVMNVKSRKRELKDIVKIEGRVVDETELNKISLIAPFASINIIKDFKVTEKKPVRLPEKIVGILKCQNPSCISNQGEPVTGTFYVYTTQPLKLKCAYCERIQSNILDYFI